MTKRSPFDYVKSIQNGAKLEGELREYIPWIVNNALSYHIDSLMVANVMNQYHDIPEQSQYDFLYGTVSKQRRPFRKMGKSKENPDYELISRLYNINKNMSHEIIALLTEEELAELRLTYYKGGE